VIHRFLITIRSPDGRRHVFGAQKLAYNGIHAYSRRARVAIVINDTKANIIIDIINLRLLYVSRILLLSLYERPGAKQLSDE